MAFHPNTLQKHCSRHSVSSWSRTRSKDWKSQQNLLCKRLRQSRLSRDYGYPRPSESDGSRGYPASRFGLSRKRPDQRQNGKSPLAGMLHSHLGDSTLCSICVEKPKTCPEAHSRIAALAWARTANDTRMDDMYRTEHPPPRARIIVILLLFMGSSTCDPGLPQPVAASLPER